MTQVFIRPRDDEWAGRGDKRCRARLNERFLRYRGRCGLKKNHSCHHALERGMEIVLFQTVHQVQLSDFAQMIVDKKIVERLNQE